MAYMSYCRQEGTFAELRLCLSDVEAHIDGEADDVVSDREIRNFKGMVECFYNFLMDQDLLTDEGELDEERLEEVCQSLGTCREWSYVEDDDNA